MSDNSIFVSSFVISIGIAAGFAYGAYWAYQIRSALVSPLYRNRALWVGAAGTFFALLVLSTILIGTFAPTDRFLSLVQFGLTNFGVILVFGWIDSSVRIARRSDPLRRNTLHWTKLRIFIWVILSIAILGNLASVLATDIFELVEPNIEFDRGIMELQTEQEPLLRQLTLTTISVLQLIQELLLWKRP